MHAPGPNYLASKLLDKLRRWYGRDDAEEVVMNRPEEVWFKPKGADWERHDDPALTFDYIEKVCRVLANINKAKFSLKEMPVVSCELPGEAFRFQAIMGNAVRYADGDQMGLGIAIRSLVGQLRSPSDWGLTNQAKLAGPERLFRDFEGIDGHLDRIQQVIDSMQTIVVSGATSTGKTTFLNSVIAMIDPRSRILTVEDTRELKVPHLNRLHLMVQRNQGTNAVDYNVIINALMRMTPDWIACGELSIQNAAPIYSLMGKGHPVLTTVHAGNVEEAYRAFLNNMAAAGAKMDTMSLLETLKTQIGCVIQIDRRRDEQGITRRLVTEIAFPAADLARESAIRARAKLAEMEDIEQQLLARQNKNSDNNETSMASTTD